jgi:hypothetical protein
MRRITPQNILALNPDEVFVFGSNEAGRHGKGAALQAMKFGAKYGQGYGATPQTYAIPTKDDKLKTLPVHKIRVFVLAFTMYAMMYSKSKFLVTPIGCGLAGYKPEDIAPLFQEASELPNVYLPESFWDIIDRLDSNL